MTTQLLFLPTIAFASGVFAPGAKARFFLSGTSTPVTVYTDTDFLVPAASPLVADAAGRFAQIFHNGTSEVRCVITAADDTAIADIDPVGRSNSTGSAADDLSFTPITGNPATDVQAAIAANTAAIQTKAPLASPALTGTPTAPTAAAGTNTTQIATTEFVKGNPIGSDYLGDPVTMENFYEERILNLVATNDAATEAGGDNVAGGIKAHMIRLGRKVHIACDATVFNGFGASRPFLAGDTVIFKNEAAAPSANKMPTWVVWREGFNAGSVYRQTNAKDLGVEQLGVRYVCNDLSDVPYVSFPLSATGSSTSDATFGDLMQVVNDTSLPIRWSIDFVIDPTFHPDITAL